ncbi:MAG: nucleotide exchange factor GrpE [Christensenellales bacterium]|jgi:molecular chaperone GrpE|nr:nucleotide exchange factor GrpE [Clostridiales bacterium]
MTEKKSKKTIENNVEKNDLCDIEPSIDYSVGELLEMAQKTADEYKQTAQRVQAEFENYKKRNLKVVEQAKEDGETGVLFSIIQTIDTIDVALAMIADSDENIKNGINLIKKQLLNTLEKYKVKEIICIGKDFDPNYHNAVMQEECEDKNKIIDVLQKGYIRNGKVIRYSMVKVGV